jgi:ABC-type iron transport system FetAB ATPase subunit
MLSLAFILTVAMNGRSSLYIMDEVDAALDEQNQRRVAALVKVRKSNRSLLWDGQTDTACMSRFKCFQCEAIANLELESIRL